MPSQPPLRRSLLPLPALLLVLAAPAQARPLSTPAIDSLTPGTTSVSYGGTTLLVPVFSGGQGTLEGIGPVVSGQGYPTPPIYSLLGRTFTLTVTDGAGTTVTRTSPAIVAQPPLPLCGGFFTAAQGGYRAALPLVRDGSEVPSFTWSVTGAGASVDEGQGTGAVTFTAPRSGEACLLSVTYPGPDGITPVTASLPLQVVDPPAAADAVLAVPPDAAYGRSLTLQTDFTDPALMYGKVISALLGQEGPGSDDIASGIYEARPFLATPLGFPTQTFTLTLPGTPNGIPNGEAEWGPWGTPLAERSVVQLFAENPPVPSHDGVSVFGWRFDVPETGGTTTYFVDNLPVAPDASGGTRWLLEGLTFSRDAWDAGQGLPSLFLEASTTATFDPATTLAFSRTFLPGPDWRRVVIPIQLPPGTAALRAGWRLPETPAAGPRTLYFDEVALRRIAWVEGTTRIHPAVSILPGQNAPLPPGEARTFLAQVDLPAGLDAGVVWSADAGSFQGAQWTAPAGPARVVVTATSVFDAGASDSITLDVAPLPSAAIAFPDLAGLEVAAGTSGLRAAVPEQPGCTYQWSVTGAASTAGDGTSTLTLAVGGPGPLLLTCTVTNAVGLSATASTTLTVVDVPPVIEALALASGSVPYGGTATLTPVFRGGTGFLEGIGAVNSGQSYPSPALLSPTPRTFTLTVTSPYGATSTLTSAAVACQAPALLAPPFVTAGQGGNRAVVALPQNGAPAPGITWTLAGASATLDAGQGQETATFTATQSGEPLLLSYTFPAVDGGAPFTGSTTVQVVNPPSPGTATLAVPTQAPYGQPLPVELGLSPEVAARTLHAIELGQGGPGSDDLLAGAMAPASLQVAPRDFPTASFTVTLSGLANAIPNGDGEWGPRGSDAARAAVLPMAHAELAPDQSRAGDYLWRFPMPAEGPDQPGVQEFSDPVPVDAASGDSWWLLEGWVLARTPWDPALPRPALVLGTDASEARVPFLPGTTWQRLRLPVHLPPGTRELRPGWSILPTPELRGQALFFDDLSLRPLAVVEGSTRIRPAVTILPGQDTPSASGGTRTFSARVAVPGGVDDGVVWTADAGSFQGALWTAPAGPARVVITATSTLDPAAVDSITVPVAAPVPAPDPAPAGGTLTVDDGDVAMLAGHARTFTATVTGLEDASVTWSLGDAAGGTLSDPAAGSVRYTAPRGPGPWRITATSNADPSLQASVIIRVLPVTLESLVDMADHFGAADLEEDLDGDGLVDDDDLSALEEGLEPE